MITLIIKTCQMIHFLKVNFSMFSWSNIYTLWTDVLYSHFKHNVFSDLQEVENIALGKGNGIAPVTQM